MEVRYASTGTLEKWSANIFSDLMIESDHDEVIDGRIIIFHLFVVFKLLYWCRQLKSLFILTIIIAQNVTYVYTAA